MMEDELTPKQKALSEVIGTIIGIIVSVIICALMSGCKAKERIVIERSVDTLRTVSFMHDSIYNHDSVYVREYMRGDTVFVDKYRQVWRYKEKVVTDTAYITKIQYRDKTVKVQQPWYSSIYIKISSVITLLLLALLAFAWLNSKRNYHKKNEQEARNT